MLAVVVLAVAVLVVILSSSGWSTCSSWCYNCSTSNSKVCTGSNNSHYSTGISSGGGSSCSNSSSRSCTHSLWSKLKFYQSSQLNNQLITHLISTSLHVIIKVLSYACGCCHEYWFPVVPSVYLVFGLLDVSTV